MNKRTKSTMRVAHRSASRAVGMALLLAAGGARADGLKIENVAVVPRDAATATVKFDIVWSNAWRHGSFHDAAWVFFKAKANDKTGWQPVRLAASKVVNPAGFAPGEGTPLEFVVPDDHVGMFVRLAADGNGTISAKGVTAAVEWGTNIQHPTSNTQHSTLEGAVPPGPNAATPITDHRSPITDIRAFGIEMVYVAEGPYYLGSSGQERNRFYMMPGDDPARPCTLRQVLTDVFSDDDGGPYLVAGAGAIPTGRKKGQLWATGMTPVDGGEIPAAFPNGYAAFYAAKTPYITAGQYAAFLNTLTAEQAKTRYYAGIQGRTIGRAGEGPNAVYTAKDPNVASSGLSWADAAAYTAWAGLRPMTELEYEKAIRGPIKGEAKDASLSFWGLTYVNQGGLYERPVSAGSASGRAFTGTHGRGIPVPPADWPTAADGIVYRSGYGSRGGDEHLLTAGRRSAIDVFADRSDQPYGGWRAARSAPAPERSTVQGAAPVGDTMAGGPVGVRSLESKVPRLDRPFRADGVPGDLGKPLVTLSGLVDLFPVDKRFVMSDGRPPWHGPGDLDVKLYLVTDGEALGMAAEVTDDRHVNTQSAGMLWNGDAIQAGLVNARGVSWNFGLALTTNGVAFHQFEGPDGVLAKVAECSVTRDDPAVGGTGKAGITRYGLRMPLAALGLKPGEEFGFNIMFLDDDDNKGMHHWLQLAPGITYPFMPEKYPRFTLEK